MSRVEIASMPWGVVQDRNGNAVSATSVTLKNLDGSTATTWSAATGGSSSTATLTSDVNGTLPRFVEGGQYMVDVPSLSLTNRLVEAVPGAATIGLLNAAGFSGVDRSGVSDSAAGLSSAFTSAAGGKLILPFGTYKVLTGLTLPAAGLTLELDDAQLDFSSLAAAGVAITAAGSIGSWVNVNAVAFGATAITGAAGIESGFSAGDIVKLRSIDQFDPARTLSTHAEQAVVLSTASGTINVRSPIMGVYSTGVQVAKVTRSKLVIKGSGEIIGGGSGSGHFGLRAKWVNALRIEGSKIAFRDVEATAIQLWDCVDYDIANLDVSGSNNSGTGYGVSAVNACQNGRVHHSTFRDCRHATSTNNSATDNGGIPRHLTWDHCTSKDSTADAFDAHAAAEHLTWDTCKVYDSAAAGYNVECNKARVIDCEGYRISNEGVRLLAAASGATSYVVKGCQLEDIGLQGIRMLGLASAGATAPEIFEILDNNIVRASLDAVFVNPTAGSFRLVGAKINGNHGHSCSSGGGNACFFVNLADASQVCDNQAINQPDGVIGTRLNDFTRGTWTGNVTSFAATGTSKGHYGVGVTDSVVGFNVARNATGAGCEGLELDATSANNVTMANALRSATVPLQLNGVTSHITTTADAAGAYNKVA